MYNIIREINFDNSFLHIVMYYCWCV